VKGEVTVILKDALPRPQPSPSVMEALKHYSQEWAVHEGIRGRVGYDWEFPDGRSIRKA